MSAVWCSAARIIGPGGWCSVSESSVLTFAQAERVATIQIEGHTLSGSTVAITMSPRHASGGDSMQVEPLGE